MHRKSIFCLCHDSTLDRRSSNHRVRNGFSAKYLSYGKLIIITLNNAVNNYKCFCTSVLLMLIRLQRHHRQSQSGGRTRKQILKWNPVDFSSNNTLSYVLYYIMAVAKYCKKKQHNNNIIKIRHSDFLSQMSIAF